MALDDSLGALTPTAATAKAAAAAKAEAPADHLLQHVSTTPADDDMADAAQQAAEAEAAAGPRQLGMSGADGLSGAALRQYFQGQLMQPEWMTDVPPDLGEQW
eukprot:jgi/Chrzof1/11398/Cz05g35080.t1